MNKLRLFAIKPAGPDLVMPIILCELDKRMREGTFVDLAEAYALLNDTQAVWINIQSHARDPYYSEIAPKIKSLLQKYDIQWVLNPDAVQTYVREYLDQMEFGFHSETLVESPEFNARPLTVYDNMLIKAFLSQDVQQAVIDSGIFKVEKRKAEEEKTFRCHDCGKDIPFGDTYDEWDDLCQPCVSKFGSVENSRTKSIRRKEQEDE